MPRYQLLVFWDELLPTSKKPSAYLPFLETSLSLMESAWPAEMVSVVVELAAGIGMESSSTVEIWRYRMVTNKLRAILHAQMREN